VRQTWAFGQVGRRCTGDTALLAFVDRSDRRAECRVAARSHFHENDTVAIGRDNIDLARSVANVSCVDLESIPLEVTRGRCLGSLA